VIATNGAGLIVLSSIKHVSRRLAPLLVWPEHPAGFDTRTSIVRFGSDADAELSCPLPAINTHRM